MSNYKLIVSDLDGTLLDDAMNLSEKNSNAISELHKLGISFVASSGRTLYEIPESIRENPNIRYVIYSNGTAIYDKEKERDIVSNRISKAVANEAFYIISDYDVIYSLLANGRSNMDKKVSSKRIDLSYYQINDYYKTLLLRSELICGIEELGRNTDGLEAVVLFFHSDEELEECKSRLNKLSGITVTSSILHNLELCSSRAGKGRALSQLADLLSIARESIIAIGDNMNDTSMFSEAGLSLCVENGSEDAKSLADKVICSNLEGVADYVLKNIIIK